MGMFLIPQGTEVFVVRPEHVPLLEAQLEPDPQPLTRIHVAAITSCKHVTKRKWVMEKYTVVTEPGGKLGPEVFPGAYGFRMTRETTGRDLGKYEGSILLVPTRDVRYG